MVLSSLSLSFGQAVKAHDQSVCCVPGVIRLRDVCWPGIGYRIKSLLCSAYGRDGKLNEHVAGSHQKIGRFDTNSRQRSL